MGFGASGEEVAAAAEELADFGDVEFGMFGTGADADGAIGVFFKENAGDDGINRTEDVEDAFGIAWEEVELLLDGVGECDGDGAVVFDELASIEAVAEEVESAAGVGLVDLTAEGGDVYAEADEFSGDFEGVGGGAVVLEGAGVGGYGGEEVGGDGGGDGSVDVAEEVEEDLACGGGFGVDVIISCVVFVGYVVVNVDGGSGREECFDGGAKAFGGGGIEQEEEVEGRIVRGGCGEEVGVGEVMEFLGAAVFVPDGYGYMEGAEPEGGGEARAEGVGVGPVMTCDEDGFGCEDCSVDFVEGMVFYREKELERGWVRGTWGGWGGVRLGQERCPCRVRRGWRGRGYRARWRGRSGSGGGVYF